MRRLRVAGGSAGTCLVGEGSAPAPAPALEALEALCAQAFGQPRQRAAAAPAAPTLR